MDSKPTQQKLIIGLTGGIGSGKTTVSDIFATLGVTVIDADEIAKQLVAKDSPALKSITEHFGNSILTNNAELDRAQLRKIIFNNEAKKTWLENLLHPLIRQEIFQQTNNASSPYIILVVPLLLESQQYHFVNRILVVDTDTALQIERSTARDNTNAAEVEKIIAAQMSREARLARAADIIHNNQDIASLKLQVLELHQQYLQYAKAFHTI